MTARKRSGPKQRSVPGDRGSPIVTGNHRLLGAERIEQSHHVADEMEQSVLVDRLGPIRLAVAAHVRCNGAESGRRQRSELMAPGIPGFRKAVAQNHERPVALLGNVQLNAVRLDGALRDARLSPFPNDSTSADFAA